MIRIDAPGPIRTPVENNAPTANRRVNPVEPVRFYLTEAGEKRIDRRRLPDRRVARQDRRMLNVGQRANDGRRTRKDRRRSALPRPIPQGRRGQLIDTQV